MCDGEKFVLEIVSLKGTVDGTGDSSTTALSQKPPKNRHSNLEAWLKMQT